jgi:glutamine synthetase type III
VPIIRSIERQLGKVMNPGRGKSDEMSKKSLKSRRAIRNQKETIAMIERIKEERLKKENTD